MKTQIWLMVLTVLSIFSIEALADRTLERSEILQIFARLTSQPRKTWIPAGTIHANREEYKAPKTTDTEEIKTAIREKIQEHQSNSNNVGMDESLRKMDFDAIPFNVRYELMNESTMKTSVIVKFDGERFYWEINVDSRMDSVVPVKEDAENFMANRFDMNWNKKRIFAWDGEKYTTYFLPGNHAIISSADNASPVVNGPLTAGFIPWGYGYYTYENLASIDSFATEKEVEGEIQVQLTLNIMNGMVMDFVLDPSKDYAVLSYAKSGEGRPTTYRKYSDYQLIAGKWVPMTLLLEQYDSETNRLLARDLWTITDIDTSVPGVENFDVDYDIDALVEFSSPVTERPAMYRYSGAIDTDALLADRLAFASSQGSLTQNCATAALKYTLSKLGKDVPDEILDSLVSVTTGSTSLAAMKQFVQSQGLYCRAVQTDIQTIKNLRSCQVILHIPGKSHFVVLEAVDDEYVWTIDLANDKFYSRTDRDFFGMDWTDGIALLISNRPIIQEDNFIELTSDETVNIIGGAGYSCTRLLQQYNVIFCSEPVSGLCEGYYRVFYQRWGCEAAESGSCSSSIIVRFKMSPCIEDIYIPGACNITGEWISYYMRACS